LARGMAQLHNPVGLARRYLASRNLLGGRDEDDLFDVAIQAIVNAAIAWQPGVGRSMLSWAWLYMDRDVQRELRRCARRRAELGAEDGSVMDEWLQYDPGHEPFDRAEMRVDLQRWADLAALTPLMRFIVEYFALHHGVYLRDTPLAGAPTPLHGSGHGTLKLALKHLRAAATTNRPRDDAWTRRRDRDDPRWRRSMASLERFRVIEADRSLHHR